MEKSQLSKDILLKGLARSAYISAQISANSACSGMFYEPKQPKELEKLKHHHDGCCNPLSSFCHRMRDCLGIDSHNKDDLSKEGGH